MQDKVLVIGSSGQIGSELVAEPAGCEAGNDEQQDHDLDPGWRFLMGLVDDAGREMRCRS